MLRMAVRRLEIDSGEDLGRAFFKGFADRQQTLDAREIGAAFDGADLGDA
jgi:hypothetical protein